MNDKLSKLESRLLDMKKRGEQFDEGELLDLFESENLSEGEFEKLLSFLKEEQLEPLQEKPFPKSAASPKDGLTAYYVEMGKHPALSVEETHRLARLSRSLDALKKEYEAKRKEDAPLSEILSLEKKLTEAKEAKDTLILSNLRLVVSIAKKYAKTSSIPLIDLIQEGNIGLERAVEKYDPDKGFRFSTYAYWWIRQGILHALNVDSRPIKIPKRLLKNYKTVQEAKDRLSQTLGRDPSLPELASDTGLSAEEIDECFSLPLNTVSIDAPIGEEGDSFVSFLKDPNEDTAKNEISSQEEEKALGGAINALTDKEKDIIVRSFGLGEKEPETLEKIGKSYGITRERVRQIRERAIIKMRKRMEE